jgi:hypothetical protein
MFYYCLDGDKWIPIGSTINLILQLPHFMDTDFGLFNYYKKT